MATDLVEIALERFTDWGRFEALAADILRADGYPEIKVLGGVHDEGQDARVERFFGPTAGRLQVAFQFSLQNDVGRKVRKTITRLREAGVAFQKLVIVTTATITADLQRKLVVEARAAEGVDLDVYERRTIANRLGDPYLFSRYFPDIGKQVAELREQTEAAAAPDREREQLKVCSALLLSDDAKHTRAALVDSAVLSLLTMRPQTGAEIGAVARREFGAEILQEGQIYASLGRLVSRSLADQANSSFLLSTAAVRRIEGAGAAADAMSRAIEMELVATVEEALGETLAEVQRARLEENGRGVLAEFFRTNGLEIAKTFALGEGTLVYADATARCVEVARRGVPAHLGELLLTAVGGALASPTPEQADYFARCSRAYVALQLLNCDPSLREFQVTRFRTKTFVLDTDFVLHALIGELPLSTPYRNLHRDLKTLGGRVVVPEAVVREVVTHLDIAPRTFDYFGGGFNGLTAELATARIWNALVRGYWHATVERGHLATREGFFRYRENYFHAVVPEVFVVEALREALPGADIVTTGSLCAGGWSEEDESRLSGVLDKISKTSPKGPDRTEEQRREIANVDARLFLSLQAQNREARGSGGVLGKAAYIVTSSGRFIRAALDIGEKWAFSARPQVLATLVSLVTPRAISDKEYVALFENPLLQRAIDDSWPQLKVMLAAGLDLRGRSLPRLRADVELRLHEQITRLEEADNEAECVEEPRADQAEGRADGEHLRLLQEARRYGYRTAGLLEDLLDRRTENADEITRLARENEELRARVKRFGRKHERWLRRLSRKP